MRLHALRAAHSELPELPRSPHPLARAGASALAFLALASAGLAGQSALAREEHRSYVVTLAALEEVVLVARLEPLPEPSPHLRAPEALEGTLAPMRTHQRAAWYDELHARTLLPPLTQARAVRARARLAALARAEAARIEAARQAAARAEAARLEAARVEAARREAARVEAARVTAVAAAKARAQQTRARTPAPPPRAARSRPAAGSSEAVIRSIWPDHLEDRAVRVARCESGLNPRASNRGRYLGLFQLSRAIISQYGGSTEDAFDATWNTQTAYKVYQDRGWQPWSCRNA